MNYKGIQKLFNYFGVKLTRFTKSEFEYLLNKPRYQNKLINFNGKNFEIADCLSFYYSYREIFIDEIYKFHTVKKRPKILDCGSNYGTSIFYFKELYPDSNIIGVEADPKIFKMLKKNIHQRSFKNVTLINKALSNKKGSIQFFSEGADGGRTHNMDSPKNSYKVETITLDELIDGDVDFLKMDIEGAETDVLCNSNNLNRVNQLFIEYHSFSSSEQKLDILLSYLKENGFRYYIKTQFCSKQPLLKTELQLGMDLQLNIFAKRIEDINN